jgi:hypothetical protein
MARNSSTVVEHSTHYLQIKGLILAAGTGREKKMVKKSIENNKECIRKGQDII